MLLQHACVGEHDGVIKIFCVFGTGLDAGLTLDADSGDSPEILRAD